MDRQLWFSTDTHWQSNPKYNEEFKYAPLPSPRNLK